MLWIGGMMNEVTLQLPRTLYQNLEMLAEREAVPLPQYIIYILTCQISGSYTLQVIPEEDVAEQKTSFDSLLKKWGKITPYKADIILNKRELVKPEPDLEPEIISRLKTQIAHSQGNCCDGKTVSLLNNWCQSKFKSNKAL